MGCDIHWIIERKDQEGVWRAVASKSRMWATDADWANPSDRFNRLRNIGSRSYLLFGLFSGVRGDVENPLATEGAPADISSGAREELAQWEHDGHSTGWFDPLSVTIKHVRSCGGALCRGDHDYAYTITELVEFWKSWLDHYKLILEHDAGEILPGQKHDEDEHDVVWEDISGAESAHARLERLARSATLLPVTIRGASRIIVFYDN